MSDIDFKNVNHDDFRLKTVDTADIVFWRWDADKDLFFISDRGKKF